MSQKEIDEMSRTIMNWLSEEGVYKDKVVDDNAIFHYLAEFPQGSGRIIELMQPKNREDLILIGNGLTFSPEHVKKLNELEKEEKSEFLWDIKFGLLFRKSGFNITPNLDNPEKIQFTREIYYSGLNKNILMEAMRENHLCNLFVIWMFNKKFGDIVSGSEPVSPMFG